MEKDLWKKLDKVILFVPLAIIIALCIEFSLVTILDCTTLFLV